MVTVPFAGTDTEVIGTFDSDHLLDRYVLAKTGELVSTVRRQMDEYDISGACGSVRSYLDALTNWYVRRSRPRFWKSDDDADKANAYATLASGGVRHRATGIDASS